MEPRQKTENQGKMTLWKCEEGATIQFSGKLEIPVSMLPVLMELAADGRETIDLMAIGWLNKSSSPTAPRMIGHINFPTPSKVMVVETEKEEPNWDELPY